MSGNHGSGECGADEGYCRGNGFALVYVADHSPDRLSEPLYALRLSLNNPIFKRKGGISMSAVGGYGYGGGFALIVVLFILLIIVGASWGWGY